MYFQRKKQMLIDIGVILAVTGAIAFCTAVIVFIVFLIMRAI